MRRPVGENKMISPEVVPSAVKCLLPAMRDPKPDTRERQSTFPARVHVSTVVLDGSICMFMVLSKRDTWAAWAADEAASLLPLPPAAEPLGTPTPFSRPWRLPLFAGPAAPLLTTRYSSIVGAVLACPIPFPPIPRPTLWFVW